ncbi:hypothetical protein ABZ921_33605 [Streptomyces atriruber]|uniref:Uncharacterized protein n=1 Tax=Streptomyces atriruber TaxID=545121 RepID=A0ABV3BX34_9ACTN
MTQTAEILDNLAKPWHVQVRSSAALAGAVEEAAAKDDRQREEDGREKPRRKPGLAGVPASWAGETITLTPWELLHTLGRALAVSRQGTGRGLAEHWGSLKYCQALEGGVTQFMALSREGTDPKRHYRTLQSHELGKGFALAVAERIVRRQFPGHSVSAVDAEVVLQAGWVLTGKHVRRRDWVQLRPDFLLEAWRPGEPSKIVPLVCRGTHQKTAYAHKQLASASAQAEAFHVGPWNTTSALVTSTELLGQGGVVVHVLQAPGTGALQVDPGDPAADADVGLRQENLFPQVLLAPAEGDQDAVYGGGFQVMPDDFAWFRRNVVRTSAAGLAAFTGSGALAARYLTERQGRENFEGFTHAGTGIVQDAEAEIRGARFLGTDHVFRLRGTRVEVFSGMAEDLFACLSKGEVEQYRRAAHAGTALATARRARDRWGGPVSLRDDGSAMAIRALPATGASGRTVRRS